MIGSILGKITFKDSQKILLENQGVGFEVFLSYKNLEKIKVGEVEKVYTFLVFSQKDIELYGFLSTDELETFKTLNGIQGIGPKTAMSLAGLGNLLEIQKILEKGELPSYVKGIGEKRLQKILLELTGKIKEIKKGEKVEDKEVIEALIGLGFSRQNVKEALLKISPEAKTSEQRIKEVLKILGK